MTNKNYRCPICDSASHMLDVVDFNKNCEENKGVFLPLSGVPVYYFMCEGCNFTFSPAFWNWSEQDFLDCIYNDNYIDIDPDYVEARPLANASALQQIFPSQKKLINHMDYGGGNGVMSNTLSQHGWNSKSYDPFPRNNNLIDELGKFNLITAFEVFEHVPNPNELMENLTKLMDESCIILFSTLISDNEIKLNSRLNWWYCSPRNGHISLYSKKSLLELGRKFNLNFGSFSDGFHCFFKKNPTWAKHLID